MMTTNTATTRAVIGLQPVGSSVGSFYSPVCACAGMRVDTHTTLAPTPLCLCADAHKGVLRMLSRVGVFILSTLLPNKGESIGTGLTAGWVGHLFDYHPSQELDPLPHPPIGTPGGIP